METAKTEDVDLELDLLKDEMFEVTKKVVAYFNTKLVNKVGVGMPPDAQESLAAITYQHALQATINLINYITVHAQATTPVEIHAAHANLNATLQELTEDFTSKLNSAKEFAIQKSKVKGI